MTSTTVPTPSDSDTLLYTTVAIIAPTTVPNLGLSPTASPAPSGSSNDSSHTNNPDDSDGNGDSDDASNEDPCDGCYEDGGASESDDGTDAQ